MASEDSNSSFDHTSIDNDEDDELDDLTKMLSTDEDDTDLIAAIEAAASPKPKKGTIQILEDDGDPKHDVQEAEAGDDGNDHLMSSLMEVIDNDNFDDGETNRVIFVDADDSIADNNAAKDTTNVTTDGAFIDNDDNNKSSDTSTSAVGQKGCSHNFIFISHRHSRRRWYYYYYYYKGRRGGRRKR